MDSLWTEGNGKQTYFPRAAPALVVCLRDWFRSQVTWGNPEEAKEVREQIQLQSPDSSF